MSKKYFKGLCFKYTIENKQLCGKFKTIEDFLETDFPKNNNPLSPTNETEIYNIVWNHRLITANKYVKTVSQLKQFFLDVNVVEVDETIEDVYEKKHVKKLSTTNVTRKSTHEIEVVYSIVKDVLFESDKRNAKVNLDGDIIKGNSHRYQTFFAKGTKCVCCGIEGKYFAKEKGRNAKSYHLNLYAIDKDGNEVLMTKDHIVPKSKGGHDHIDNYQTMCEVCNMAKGNKMEE
jgi:hypothetical protein